MIELFRCNDELLDFIKLINELGLFVVLYEIDICRSECLKMFG